MYKNLHLFFLIELGAHGERKADSQCASASVFSPRLCGVVCAVA